MIHKKGWLKDNVTSVLTIIWTLAAVGIFYSILYKEIKADDNTTNQLMQGIFGISMFILGYYFAASKGINDHLKKQDDETITSITLAESNPVTEENKSIKP